MNERARQDGGDTEEIDALAVPVDTQPAGVTEREVLPEVSSPRPIAVAGPARALADLRAAPALQAAAVAAGGFLAGAAVVGLAHRRHSRAALVAGRSRRGRRLRSERGRQGQRELTQVVASRSFLVDVHLLGSSGRPR